MCGRWDVCRRSGKLNIRMLIPEPEKESYNECGAYTHVSRKKIGPLSKVQCVQKSEPPKPFALRIANMPRFEQT